MYTVIQICVCKLIRKKTGLEIKNVNMLAEVIFDCSVLTDVSRGSPRPSLGLVFTRRPQASAYSLTIKIYYSERIQSKISKGKMHVG